MPALSKVEDWTRRNRNGVANEMAYFFDVLSLSLSCRVHEKMWRLRHGSSVTVFVFLLKIKMDDLEIPGSVCSRLNSRVVLFDFCWWKIYFDLFFLLVFHFSIYQRELKCLLIDLIIFILFLSQVRQITAGTSQISRLSGWSRRPSLGSDAKHTRRPNVFNDRN